ncbi:MAG: HAMP domain-containing histidine kinase [Ktedonobacterales bacterium]|nr:HAMP domain-containing histidine kinase [Ktedonobacterales bacterium]
MATMETTIQEFLDLAGHDLRIPITALKSQIQLMQRRWRKHGMSESDLADLDRLLHHTERLNYMLQVLLDAAHVAKDGIQLLPAEFEYDLTDLVARAVKTTMEGGVAHPLQLETPPDGKPMLGNWDRLRIETVLNIVLSNALKYSADADVAVRLSREEDMARVEVSDRGLGVPSGERRAIFLPYRHGSNVENPGTGLGLYVARAIVKAHGGQIGVRARQGGGSIFWFTLPFARLIPLSEAAFDVLATHTATGELPSAAAKKPRRKRAVAKKPAALTPRRGQP